MNETEAEMLLTNQINMSQGNDFTVLTADYFPIFPVLCKTNCILFLFSVLNGNKSDS